MAKNKMTVVSTVKYFFMILLPLVIFACGNYATTLSIKEIPVENGRYDAYFCSHIDCSGIISQKITEASKSVDCAVYSLKSLKIKKALELISKNVAVRVVVDSDNFENEGGGHARAVKAYGIMHNKFCVIDNKTVITGSFNPADLSRDDNNLIIVSSSLIASNYYDEFMELWENITGKGDKTGTASIIIDGNTVENYFCPEDCQIEALQRIIGLIRNAKESVKVASFTFTLEEIADELVLANSRGVNVTVLIEGRQRNVKGSQYQRLKDFGVDIMIDNNKYDMHHKFIVIDSRIVITGSPNFTLSGFNRNDENILIISDENLASEYIKEFDRLNPT